MYTECGSVRQWQAQPSNHAINADSVVVPSHLKVAVSKCVRFEAVSEYACLAYYTDSETQ